MKNCCELLSKLLQSLDLKDLKTIRLMWPQLQTKNLKTAGLLWPELKLGTSKLQNFWISVAPAANQKLKTSKQLGYCDRSSKSKPQTSKHLDNSGASCNSKLQTFQNLFNYLITVANSQKFKTRGQAVALAANQNNNSEIAGLFCLQLQIKNSRQSLRIAASKRPRTSKP